MSGSSMYLESRLHALFPRETRQIVASRAAQLPGGSCTLASPCPSTGPMMVPGHVPVATGATSTGVTVPAPAGLGLLGGEIKISALPSPREVPNEILAGLKALLSSFKEVAGRK